ncbi:OPT/YSL family transporter [Anaeromyxobacter paludicola]|nr:OPT/YSL family transporter [Anaeromyxobacter paludicola]
MRVPAEAQQSPLPAEPRRELTLRAVLTAMAVAALIGASYPYVVLKIGYGPNISVVSAFFGYLALGVIGLATGARGTRWENNLVQTAGTAAGQAGFMCTLLAAFDMLNAKPELGFSVHLSTLQIFSWLTVAGLLGVLLAVPLRRHYIDEENLPFADGTAAGETMLVLDLDRREAAHRVRALGLGLLLSALVAVVRDLHWKLKLAGDRVLQLLPLIPGEVGFGAHGAALRMGSEVSLLSFGSGLLVGLRVTLSMGLGMIVAWVLAPPLLVGAGVVPEQTFAAVLRWVMWPATGLMVSGGLTALALKWKVVLRSFQGLSRKQLAGAPEEFPMRLVVWGALGLSVALAVVQKISLGFPFWLTAVSLLLSLPLMLVGTRVLGETNWAPISALANLMQAVFAAIVPGHIPVNMIGSGMSGTVAANGEHLMQDYRAGQIVGANYRHLTIVQLLAVPVGSLAVAVAYPALRARYGVGGDGLSSPISVKWAGFAELLAKGFSTLPKGCLTALAVALALGVVLTVLEADPRRHRYLPSPTAVGLGMLIPGYAVLPMVLGGLVQALWRRFSPKGEESYCTPLASGFIAGEALVVLLLSILAMAGVAL